MVKVIIAAIVITIVGLFVMSKIDPARNSAVSSAVQAVISSEEGAEDTSKVNITGQILHPGDYLISPQKCLSDLITMAGGVLDNADPNSYTPGLLIGTRTSFYIAKAADVPATCSITVIAKVNINTAEEEALKTAGFSSSQATALVTYRTEHGLFQAIEDIMKVSGIGQKTYLAVRDKISIS